MNDKTFIIAEAGANHDRNYEQAIALIDTAIEAKSNAVKFQTYSSETLYAKNTPDFAGYKNINKLIKDIELPRSWQSDLKSYCDDNGIEFMSTPFDERAVDELYELGVKRYKIAGFEATDPRFVKYVASTGLPLIISAGIGVNINMVHNIVDWVLSENKNPDLTILHCNNAYPTPIEDINLGQIQELKNMNLPVQIKVGLSDHTEGILVPPLAIMKGAACIEKHFTLSRTLPGPDHPFAIEPIELKNMVDNIRKAELTVGTKSDQYTQSEVNFAKARRSVVSKVVIKKGEKFSKENLTTKRPALENSIPALNYYEILGKTASKDIKESNVLFWNDVEK